jgi:hypothetical protein
VAVSLLSGLAVGGAAAAAAATTTSTTAPTSTATASSTSTSSTSTSSTTTTSTPSTTTTSTAVPSTTTTTVAPQGLISSAMNAFVSQRAVDWTYHLSAFGRTYAERVDAGAKDGVEADTVTVGGSIGGSIGRVSLILDGKLYIEGDATGLAQDAGFTAAAAQNEANKWIAVPKSSPEFSLSGGMTVPTAVNQLYIGGKIKTLPPTKIDGQAVLAVNETTKSNGFTISETVYIKATGVPLPLEVVQNIEGLQAKIVYGPWDKPPAAFVPQGSVAIHTSWIAKS